MGSLNSGGSFIFERPGYLTVWTGKFVPQKMQGKLRKVMKKIGEERGGQPEVPDKLCTLAAFCILHTAHMHSISLRCSHNCQSCPNICFAMDDLHIWASNTILKGSGAFKRAW